MSATTPVPTMVIEASPGTNNIEGRNVVFFNLVFHRGTDFYVQNVIVPVAIFSYCSIMTMVIGVGAFQTIGLNFTLLLVSVAQKIAVASLLPVTNEKLWLVDFVFGSFYFIVATLVESFFKFILLKIREEHQNSTPPPDEEGAGGTSPRSWIPSFFLTFSTRKMDVICCWLSFITYTIYIIVFFAARHTWGDDVTFNPLQNSTHSEL